MAGNSTKSSEEEFREQNRILYSLCVSIAKFEAAYQLQVHADRLILLDAIGRLRKDILRGEQFQGKINDVKIICLLSFWLIKLKPFRIDPVDRSRKHSNDKYLSRRKYLNEFIAFYLLMSVLYKVQTTICLNAEYIHHLFYSLRYRDLSSNALICLFESFKLHRRC